MSNRDDLINGAEKYLRRELTDDEKQQLMHASNSFKLGDNDALWIVISMLESNKWSLTETLESYRQEFEAIPEQIKKAADAERESLTATANVGAIQAQDRINDSVLALLPNIRADITKAVGRSASTAIRQAELGRGLFPILGTGMVAGGLIYLGVLVDSGIYREVLLNPKNQQYLRAFNNNLNWALTSVLAFPSFLALGCFLLQDEYNDQAKFAGSLIIFVAIVGFLIPGLKIMGWWFWK
jgi:hypothetical protein